jgi:hypothetical protein
LLGRLIFLLEFGRALISGKKDSVDFIKSEDFSIAYCLSIFLARILLKSKPPPVISSFLAFLYYSARDLISSCSRIYFLKASSALFWVYFRLYSYSDSLFNFSSSNLCLSSSAFLFLSSSFNYF